MTPCLADTGSNYSMLIVGVIVLLIGVGVALLLVKQGKGAAGGALLVLFLVGAGTLGTTGASPARAASPSTSCSTSSPTPAPVTPTATSTPIVTPTPPPPTCAPQTITATVDLWGYGETDFRADIDDPASISALGTTPIDGASATVVVTDTDSGNTLFSGVVTYSYNPEGAYLSIPTDVLRRLAGEGSEWPLDQSTDLALSFTLNGVNDCPITVTVTGQVAVPE